MIKRSVSYTIYREMIRQMEILEDLMLVDAIIRAIFKRLMVQEGTLSTRQVSQVEMMVVNGLILPVDPSVHLRLEEEADLVASVEAVGITVALVAWRISFKISWIKSSKAVVCLAQRPTWVRRACLLITPNRVAREVAGEAKVEAEGAAKPVLQALSLTPNPPLWLWTAAWRTCIRAKSRT